MSLLGCLALTEGYIVAYLLPLIYRKKVTLSQEQPALAPLISIFMHAGETTLFLYRACLDLRHGQIILEPILLSQVV